MTDNKIKFLLIIPSSKKSVQKFSEIGASYLVSYLRSKDIDVSVIDGYRSKNEKEAIKSYLVNNKPALVGFSLNIKNKEHALTLVEFVKQISPVVKTVVGGQPPSVKPENYSDFFDYVIRGDGEIPLYELLTGKNPNDILGLFTKTINNGINYEPLKLEELAFPDTEVLGLKTLAKSSDAGIYPTFATRGCGGQCIFCTGKEFNKKHRLRDVNDVLTEMRKAKYEYKASEVAFCDPSFTFNMEYTQELCKLFIENKEDILPWSTGTRMDKIDKDLVLLMKEAGCISLGFGLETADENIMRIIKKTYDTKKAEEIVNYCNELGLYTFTTIMYGVFGETKESLKKTLKMTLSLPFDMAFYGIFELNDTIVGNYSEPEEKIECSPRYLKCFLFYSYMRFYIRPFFLKRLLFRKINRQKGISMFLVVFGMLFNFIKIPGIFKVPKKDK